MPSIKTVEQPSSAVLAMRGRWHLVEDLMDGEYTMRQAGERWLPRGSIEPDKDFARRLKMAVLNPGFSETVKTFVGKPFSSRMIRSEDMPDEMRQWCNDIDCCGNNIGIEGKIKSHIYAGA